jgi:hypothetical protein
LQMAVVLTWGAQLPVVKVGRMAGQFAKPRSAPTEVSAAGTAQLSRRHHQRLRLHARGAHPRSAADAAAYTQAAASLNLLRAFSTGGYADMHRVQSWISDFTGGAEAARYRDIADRISDAMAFMAAAGVTPKPRMIWGRWISTPATRRCCWNTKRRWRGSIRPPACRSRVGPHDLDRRPHAAAGRRACGIRRRRAEPDRAEMRPLDHGDSDLKVLMPS